MNRETVPTMSLRRLPVRWFAIAPNVRGAIWILLAAFTFSSMGALVKTLGQTLDSFEIAFFRCLVGLIVVIPFFGRSGLGALRSSRLPAHFLRAALGVSAMFCGFYAITHMPLASAVAISFTKPLFMIVLAVLLLGEAVRFPRWAATIAGFCGVLVMVRPGTGDFHAVALVALLGALLIAGVQITIKSLAETERPVTILAWFGIFTTIAALGPALLVWQTPTRTEFVMLCGVGALGALAQSFTIRGMRIAEATAVAPFDYARLLFAAGWGFLLFDEIPTVWTVLGAAIIVASTFYIARREARERTAESEAGGG